LAYPARQSAGDAAASAAATADAHLAQPLPAAPPLASRAAFFLLLSSI